MLTTLFVNNFRGFTNTYIPLKDVNFLVGENSTGKTSILKLYKLVTEAEFWLRFSFNTEDINLGPFSEIVNGYSAQKDSFEIGVENTHITKDGKIITMYWFKFTNIDDVPLLTAYKYYEKQKTIYCQLSQEKQVLYSIINETKKISFKSWIDSQVTEELYVLPHVYPLNRLIFALTLQAIEDVSRDEKTRNAGYKFPTPSFSTNWVDPIRAKAKRIYEAYNVNYSAEGEHIPVVLKKILSAENPDRTKNKKMLKAFGKTSGLFDELVIHNYGRAKNAPFSITVKQDGLPVNLTNVGYGVSQILPPLIDILVAKSQMFVIQQPEVHLHPKAQASFGDFLFQSALNQHNSFMIETHSNYMIDRFRYAMHCESNQLKVQVLYFYRANHGTEVQPIDIDTSGRLQEERPIEYDEFFVDEDIKLMEV